MRKLFYLLLFGLVTLPLAFARADAGYEKAKKNLTEKRIPYWENILKKPTGNKVKILVDFNSYPKTAKAMKKLDFDVLSRIRGSFNSAQSKKKGVLKGKIVKVQIRHDPKSKKSAYRYSAMKKILNVVTSPGEKNWVNAIELVNLLKSL